MKKIIIFLTIIILVAAVIAGGYFYFQKLVNTANQNNQPSVIVEVKEGASSMTIAKDLQSIGAIKSARAFVFYEKLHGKVIRAGFYSIRFDHSIAELIEKLSSGEYLLTKITIPEGKRVEQIAALLQDKGIFNYNDFLDVATNSEGKLMADTYYIGKKTSAADFVKMMTDNFANKTADLKYTSQQLVLASVVERETNIENQKAIIAGIFLNRLNIGMKLQSDPTVYYVNDSQNIAGITPYEATQYTFWQKPTAAFKTFDSPYNTYLYEGLPPKPICTPTVTSLKAAVAPQASDYFYFIHDKNGLLHAASTLEEHEANVESYL